SSGAIVGAMGAMNQVLMRPPNVAGWPGGSQWLNDGTLLARLNFLNALVTFHRPAGGEMTQNPNPMAQMPAIPDAMTWISGTSTTDPGAVTEAVLSLVLQDDSSEAQRRSIMEFLQTDSVGNPVELNGENIDEKVRGAMSLAMASPAYQLA
ncbi:MAG TPA: DUF1800 family protein, partial [Candidatus Eremiobacteraceae bacterium]|nr:DUF1800 family protein [Candidatus Eremiobacteraceae bacterium]